MNASFPSGCARASKSCTIPRACSCPARPIAKTPCRKRFSRHGRAWIPCAIPGGLKAWLMRILIDECKMLLRRRRAHRESALTGAEEDFRVPDAPPGAEEMRAALRALEEKYRLPLLLHLAEGFEVVEVARMLRLSQEAVKWRIHKGRQLLRAALEQEVRI